MVITGFRQVRRLADTSSLIPIKTHRVQEVKGTAARSYKSKTMTEGSFQYRDTINCPMLFPSSPHIPLSGRNKKERLVNWKFILVEEDKEIHFVMPAK